MKIFTLVILFIVFTFSCKNESKIKTNSSSQNQPITFEQECYYQNNEADIGIGLLIWDGNCEKTINFYSDKELTQKKFELNFCNKIIDVCPLFYKPDYGIMHFSVKNINEHSYEVYIDATNNLYLNPSQSFTFVSWKSFLMNYTTAVREINKNEIYVVKSVNGDFLTAENESTNEKKEIKWKENNKLLIEIMLLK